MTALCFSTDGSKNSLNQSRLEVTMGRAVLNKDLEELNRVLQAKEELASEIAMNDQHLEATKMQFEVFKSRLPIFMYSGAF